MDYDETIHRTANAVETVDAVEYSPMRTRRLESWLFGWLCLLLFILIRHTYRKKENRGVVLSKSWILLPVWLALLAVTVTLPWAAHGVEEG